MSFEPQSQHITADGTYRINVRYPGGPYAFGASGDFGGGTVAVFWVDRAGNPVEYEISPLEDEGGGKLHVPGNAIEVVVSGSTSPEIFISLQKIDPRP